MRVGVKDLLTCSGSSCSPVRFLVAACDDLVQLSGFHFTQSTDQCVPDRAGRYLETCSQTRKLNVKHRHIVQTRTYVYKTCKLCQITIYSVIGNSCYFVLLFGHNDEHLHPRYDIVSCCCLLWWYKIYWHSFLPGAVLMRWCFSVLSEDVTTFFSRFDSAKWSCTHSHSSCTHIRLYWKQGRGKKAWSQDTFVHPRLKHGRFRFMSQSAHLRKIVAHKAFSF